jgi:hypothetical protein
MITEQLEMLLYTAGFVDGEGYIGIKKDCKNKDKGFSPTYSERVSVAGVNKLSIESLNDLVRGSFSYHKPKNNKSRGYWMWEVTNNKARKFLRIIFPYLKVKQLDAKLVLALGKNKTKTNRKRISLEDLQLRENLYILLKTLHHPH